MTNAPMKTYDLNHVMIVINGIRLTGFGEDAVMTVEPQSNIGEHTVSADGQVTFSRNNDRRVLVTLTFRETSKAVRELFGLLQLQNAQPAIQPMPFYMQDLVNGDELSDQYATFVTWPTPSKGKNAGDREFQILLPNGLDNMILAALAVI